MAFFGRRKKYIRVSRILFYAKYLLFSIFRAFSAIFTLRVEDPFKASQNPEDLGSSVEAEDEVDKLEEGNEQAMAASNCEPDLILLYDKEISSLNTEALKAALNRRGFKKSGNKRTLVERLRAAKISEHISQAVGNDSKTSQVKEKSVNAQLLIQH